MTFEIFTIMQYTCSVPEFEASQYLVTNEEFLEFVNEGGYSRQELWTDEGEHPDAYKDFPKTEY